MALGGLWEAIDNYAQAQDELVEGANQLASAIAGAAMSAMTRDDIVDLTGYPPIWCCGFAPTRVSAGPMAELGLVCPRRFAVDGGTVAACAEDEGHLPVWAAARSLGLASPTRAGRGEVGTVPTRHNRARSATTRTTTSDDLSADKARAAPGTADAPRSTSRASLTRRGG
jgi:hypothetical protein